MARVPDSQDGVAKYYSRIGSWLGYNLVMGRSQHAGYWGAGTKSEKESQRNFLKKLEEFLKLKKGERVLDAGSGQGYAARYLAETTQAEVIGITITPREVRVSEKLSKKCNHPPSFVLGDYAHTDFPDNYFDVIYTTETLSHVRNMEQTMREFYRILKPDGRIELFDYEVDTRALTSQERDTVDFLKVHAGGYGLYQQNPGNISRCMERAGFKNIREVDWSNQTKPTYDRLRRIARPFAWVQPSSKLAPHCVNAVMASHFYSNFYESGKFRYIVYRAAKPTEETTV